jgi:hypothetical protein
MYNNTYLDMKASDHHRSEKEAAADRWQLSKQTGLTTELAASTEPEASPVRLQRILAVTFAVFVIGVLALLPAVIHEVSAQDATLVPAPEPPISAAPVSPSTDAMPGLNLMQ